MVSQKGIRSLLTRSESETTHLAEEMGRSLKPGDIVALVGEIGSGKTLFIKGLCRGLGVKDPNEVKSPTFVLLHIYEGRFPIHHFDLYRLEEGKELDAIAFDEFIRNPEAVSLIEWADRAPNRIPEKATWVELKIKGPHSRQISIKSHEENLKH
ncbi:MAG: tRNA (adenosine(37)-N6)-threonylcarbamoyltransferase complex ATPase subunit type 1 TsaE [Candidatus Omnitrophica bacterium]|nr:tRNA (adenosine(37)-N6)-threonylcarbamoyltransferase complex ATPase subunit type 1 TsaE [Candidatus Omnitrophota bacterium]